MASLLGLLAGALTATILWLCLPQPFCAETRLRLTVPRPDAASHEDENLGRFQKSQVELIESSTVLETVLRRPEVAALPSLQGQRDALAWLGSRVHVEGGLPLDSVQVRVRSTNADEAAQLLRAIIEVYRVQASAQRGTALEQLRVTRQRMAETLAQKRQRLAQPDVVRLNAAIKEAQQARLDLRRARAELNVSEQRHPSTEPIAVTDAAVDVHLGQDPEGSKRSAEVRAIEEQIQRVIRISALRERDPSLRAYYQHRDEAQRKLKARREALRSIVEQQGRARAIEEHQKQLVRLRERVAYCENLLASLEAEIHKLGGVEAEEQQKTVRAEIAAGSESLHALDAEILRARNSMAATEAGEAITVVAQDASRRVQLAGLGGAGSGALLVLAVSWRELRRRRITARSDLEHGLDVPVIGDIPEVRKNGGWTPADLEEPGPVSEAVDSLRTVLLHEAGSGPRLLLVTSAVAGEGKTTLTAQLAASMARGWRKTLLIDADLRKPEAHALFDTPLEPGLSELLRGEAEVADVIQPTELSRLWIISAGHWDTHAIQALAQEGAKRLFDRLKEQFDFIIFDSGPVLPVADVMLLSTYVDTVLLAVRSGKSRLPGVQAAHQRLANLEVPVRGAVLIGRDTDLGGRSIGS